MGLLWWRLQCPRCVSPTARTDPTDKAIANQLLRHLQLRILRDFNHGDSNRTSKRTSEMRNRFLQRLARRHVYRPFPSSRARIALSMASASKSKLGLFEGDAEREHRRSMKGPEKIPHCSSHSMRAAATGTPGTCNPWTTSAMAHEFPSCGFALSKHGEVVHTLLRHVSILKFIERNWSLKPLTARSRDKPEKSYAGANATLRGNSPAIGDLFDMFDFHQSRIVADS